MLIRLEIAGTGVKQHAAVAVIILLAPQWNQHGASLLLLLTLRRAAA